MAGEVSRLYRTPSITETFMSAQLDVFRFTGARALILKHRHEQENGRTSAVTVEIMGYKVIFLLLKDRHSMKPFRDEPLRLIFKSVDFSKLLTVS